MHTPRWPRASRLLAVALALVTAGCSDDESEPLAPLPAPRVVARTEPAALADCPNGGTVVLSGFDRDRDGLLDDAEATERTIVCADMPEAPPAVLVRVDDEPAGERCGEGGSAVRSGLDTDRDGVLDDDEVTATDYVCADALLTRMAAEPAGARCAGGGIVFSVGRDANGDRELGDDEVEWTEVECSDVVSRDVTLRTAADVALIAEIKAIQGALVIVDTGLTSVVLPELEHIGEALVVKDNPLLERLSMPALDDVGGYLQLADNARLATVELVRLRRTGGSVSVHGNPTLTALTDFGVDRVDGSFNVVENETLAAVDTPSIVRDKVEVVRNPALRDLVIYLDDDVNGITVLENGLVELRVSTSTLLRQPRLGPIRVTGNRQLEELSVSAPTVESISATGNEALADVSVSASMVAGDVDVQGPNLGNVFVSGLSPRSGIQILGTLRIVGPAEHFGVSPADDSSVGHLVVRDTQLTRLAGAVDHVRGDVRIEHNPRLLDVVLVTVGGDVTLHDNDELRHFRFVEQDDLEGDVVIWDNEALEHLAGLQHTHRVRGSLIVRDNPNLVYPAIHGIVEIGVDLRFVGNARLEQFDLSSLAVVGGTVSISENGLAAWSGLRRLERVGALTVRGNPRLADIVLPALEEAPDGFQVAENPQLAALVVPLLTRSSGMTVRDNPLLAACAVDRLFTRVSPARRHQSGNDTTATCPASAPTGP